MKTTQYFTHITTPGFFEYKSSFGGVTTVYKLTDNLQRKKLVNPSGTGYAKSVDGDDVFEVAIIRTSNLKPHYK